jgi:3-deoxy-manno-octulosonate cytidylyltransferase (CMP-KDO synthetase)
MKFTVIVPARYSSTRLARKMLADLGGKPLVIHAADRAKESGAQEVIIATDHAEIVAVAKHYGHTAALTHAGHASGTDRIAEVAAQRNYTDDHIVVNVQGDEPLIPPTVIRSVARNLACHAIAAVSTACCRIEGAHEFANPAIVKVVLDRDGYALYFSRAPIPYPRDTWANASAPTPHAPLPEGLPAWRHIGIYGFRAGFLRSYAQLTPSPLEKFESLEQLRMLWHGHRINVIVTTDAPPPGVDTAEDLERVRAALAVMRP